MLKVEPKLLPFFIDRRGSDPVTDVDDDAFGSHELVLIVSSAQVHRPGFFGAGSFHHPKRLDIVLCGKTNMINPRALLFAVRHARSKGKHGNVDRAIGEIDSIVLTLLLDRHTERLYEKIGHAVYILRSVSNMSNLSHVGLLLWLSAVENLVAQISHCQSRIVGTARRLRGHSGILHFTNEYRMIAFLDTIDQHTLDKSGCLFQNRRAQTALTERFSADTVTFPFQRFEKCKRHPLLVLAKNIQRKDFRLFDDGVSTRIGLDANHNQGRLKSSLCHPVDRRSGNLAILSLSCQNVQTVRNHS